MEEVKKVTGTKKFKFSLGWLLKWAFLIVMSVMIIFPFIMVLLNSFKTPQEYIQTGVFALPKHFYLGNYKINFYRRCNYS